MTPVISVIMPVRNGSCFLREAVASVLRQERRDFELIIVDDGSDDASAALLADLAFADERIVLIRQGPLGIAAALNRAVAAARAPFIARLDADDCARPDRLGRQLAFMEAHGEIGLLGSAAEKIDASGAVIGHLAPPMEPAALARMLARINPFIHSSVMMRTDLVRRLDGYRAAFRAAEDYDLWLRMAELAGIAIMPEALVQYRWHASNLSHVDAVRQSFSVRLAQRAAAARRSGAADPADRLAAPPDWWATEAATSFFCADVALYRFLDPAQVAQPSPLSAVVERLFDLNHVERKLAQERLHPMLDGAPLPTRLKIGLLIVALHPGRAGRLLSPLPTGGQKTGTDG